MTSLTVKAVDGETNLYGKHSTDLQENIVVGTDSITGSLKKVTEYTQAFGNTEEKDGHFLALAFEFKDGTTVKTKVVGGTHGEVDCTSDKYCVYRITNKDTQSIEVKATTGGNTETATYSLKGLTLLES